MLNTTESTTSLLSKSTIEEIAEKYLIASVTTHFFRGLMSLQTLAYESQDLPIQRIRDRLNTLTASVDSFAKLMETYGLIIALSLKDDLSVSPALRHYASLNKDWIGEIAALANGNKVPLDQYGIPFVLPAWEPMKPNLGSHASTTEGRASGQIAKQEEGND